MKQVAVSLLGLTALAWCGQPQAAQPPSGSAGASSPAAVASSPARDRVARIMSRQVEWEGRLAARAGHLTHRSSERPASGPEHYAWHHALVRDRRQEARLHTARQQLHGSTLASALEALQRVLERDVDVFVRDSSSATPSGAHLCAETTLAELSAEQLETYELLHGIKAGQQLNQALRDGDIAALTRVSRNYFCTQAGFGATETLASLSMARGQFASAAVWWERLWQSPIHRQRMKPEQVWKFAACLKYSGHADAAHALLASARLGTVDVGGARQPAEHWLLRLPEADLSAVNAGQLCGSASRNGSASGSPPILSLPAWTAPLAGPLSLHVEALVRAWEANQQTNSLPLGAAQFPLALDHSLVVRDYEGLRGIDLATGRTLWLHRCLSSLSRDVPVTAAGSDGNTDPGQIGRLLVGNAVLGILSTDGQRVFAIDALESRWQQVHSSSGQPPDPATTLRQSNRLIALQIPTPRPDGEPATPALAWSAGGSAADQLPLAGHFFLGVPTVVEDRLYGLTEYDQQLFAVCLQGCDGRVLWTQPLCMVALPIHADLSRYYLTCTPSAAQGVLVFPTHMGVLVGVRALDGALLWAASHDNAEQVQQLTTWPNNSRQPQAHRGYLNAPLIQDDRVIYLPPQSEDILCADLRTGQVHWRERRQDMEQATEYVAAASSEGVLIVGRWRCRALSLRDGSELWSVRLTSSPSGRGVRIGESYLIPLSEGTLACLDVATGRPTGYVLPRAEGRPGNLVAVKNVVVSLGLTSITAYPQAATLLSQIESVAGETPDTPETELQGAELELALGRLAAADARLERLLMHLQSHSAVSERTEELARRVLRLSLAHDPHPRAGLLRRLEHLSHRPDDRARYLWELATHCQTQGDVLGAVQAGRELVLLNSSQPFRLDDDPTRLVAHVTSLRELLAPAPAPSEQDGTPGTTLPSNLEQFVQHDLDAALQSGDIRRLQSLSALYGGQACAQRVRLGLAGKLAALGQYSAAELELHDLRQQGGTDLAAQASAQLLGLYEDRGRFCEAGKLLWDLQNRYGEVHVRGHVTGREFVRDFSRQSPTWQAYERLLPPRWTGARARITEERWLDPQLQASYNATGAQQLPTPRWTSLELLDKGRNSAGSLLLIDRHTGAEFQQPIRIPSRYYYPTLVPQATGHFVALGTTGAAHGVSLLDRQVVWTSVPPGLQNCSELVRVGPTGPGYAVFQCRQFLFAVDPATGQLMWERSDLESQTGLWRDPNVGLFGDHRRLVLFANDRAHYCVYDTRTGAEVRRGKLDIDRRESRRAFGGHLFHVTGSATDRRLRVWDAEADRFVIDLPWDELCEASPLSGLPAGTRVFTFVPQADELALVTRDGWLQVRDVRTGEFKLNRRLEPAQIENLSSLRVFQDRLRYYVNLQRVPQPGDAHVAATTFIASDTTLPAVHIHGDMLAIDRATGDELWRRDFGSRSVLQFSDFPLPVMLTLCRIRRGTMVSLQLEVVQTATGEVTVQQDQLLADRIVQAFYDADKSRLELRGARTRIHVDFLPDAPELATAGSIPVF